ncbi:DUF3761 domain-containing protein [Actinoallomurus rhizosphaericola]|uniref:DUF3761 domain-containing protein n=1 Tax=Actinoallomurus rhizosphaericola TaxID=2952536 RepID=UPI00209118E0|nr:DUF3761 domain-containing protein [Actinoallomurus rhizosphaericola]MCO5992500.1 DUF3761 domain-containing protein [Actinoallomurus rhizosphaericola]
MRHRTPALILGAALLLGGCRTTATDAGGAAAPSDGPSVSATPADSPSTVLPPSPTPKNSSTPTVRAGARGIPTHRTHVPKPHRVPSRPKRRPAAPKPPDHPAGATARCNDGTYSYAAHHQGACSHHGGVAIFYR